MHTAEDMITHPEAQIWLSTEIQTLKVIARKNFLINYLTYIGVGHFLLFILGKVQKKKVF